MNFRFALALAGACLVALSSAGCSSDPDRPSVYPVTGVVTLEGKPVDGANVLFVPDDKSLQPASAVTDANGNYSLTTFVQGDGALPGTYRIKVLKYNAPAAASSGGEEQRFLTYEEEQKLYAESQGRPAPPPKNLLPKKYESETRSGLTHTVPESATTFDINLE